MRSYAYNVHVGLPLCANSTRIPREDMSLWISMACGTSWPQWHCHWPLAAATAKTRMSKPLHTAANESQRPRWNCIWSCHYMPLLYVIHGQMTLVSRCCQRTNNLTKYAWHFNRHNVQRPVHLTRSTVVDSTVAQYAICLCYPEWHNFPICFEQQFYYLTFVYLVHQYFTVNI